MVYQTLTLLFQARRLVNRINDQGQAMALRINILQYNRFMFRQRLFFVRKTGPIHLKLVGVLRQNDNEIQIYFEILHRMSYLNFYFIQYQCSVIILLLMQLFSSKVYLKACFEEHKIWLPLFSWQSLLLTQHHVRFLWQALTIHFVTKDKPIHKIDGKCHIKKLTGNLVVAFV